MPTDKKMIGRYEIRGTLGKGAMGAVYKGWDTRLELDVAIKVLLPGNDDSNREEEITRFLREVKISRTLKHPNIVAVYDVGDDPDTGMPYIVMEFIHGKPLNSLMRDRHLTIQEIVTMTCQIADGLDFAGQAGVVHRDIKPANILVNTDTLVPKVVDFGVARIEGTNATQAGTVLGTPHYMSPEQCRGETVDGRSDLFSLGAMLYEMLTNQKAFPGETIVNVMMGVLDPSKPDPPGDLRPEIPYALSQAVMKALAKDPAERYQRGQDMVAALKGALGTTPEATMAIRPGQLPALEKTIIAKASGTTPFSLASSSGRSGKAAPATTGFPVMYAVIGAIALLVAGGGAWFAMKPSLAPVTTAAPVPGPNAPAPPAASVPTPPLAMTAAMTVELGVVKDAKGQTTLLNEGESLRPTDGFGVFVKPEGMSYIYIWQTDSSGEVFRIFPNADFHPQGNPVPAGKQVWLPSVRNQRQWFHLDQNPGEEEIVIVASKEALPDLEDPLGMLSMTGVVDANTKQKIIGDLHKAQAKLSAGKDKGGATLASQPSSGALPSHTLEGNATGFYYQIRLKHL